MDCTVTGATVLDQHSYHSYPLQGESLPGIINAYPYGGVSEGGKEGGGELEGEGEGDKVDIIASHDSFSNPSNKGIISGVIDGVRGIAGHNNDGNDNSNNVNDYDKEIFRNKL